MRWKFVDVSFPYRTCLPTLAEKGLFSKLIRCRRCRECPSVADKGRPDAEPEGGGDGAIKPRKDGTGA